MIAFFAGVIVGELMTITAVCVALFFMYSHVKEADKDV